MRCSWMFGGPRRAFVHAAAVVVVSAVITGCSDPKKRRVVGDPCEKADECQCGRCDEHRCIKKVPLEPEEPCGTGAVHGAPRRAGGVP